LALLSGRKKSDGETKSGSQETVEEKEKTERRLSVAVVYLLTQSWYGVFFLVGVRSLSYLVCFKNLLLAVMNVNG